MTKYKLVPVEPTREMWSAAGDAVVALKSQHHDAISEAVYKAMLATAPDVQWEPVAWYLPGEGGYDSQFRDHATVKSCTGNPWEGWQPLYATPQPAEQQPTSHDWDDQDKCRRCGDRDWYASATCTPKQQLAPDVKILVEALESILHGSLLDACGNRDDDGISSAISIGIQRDSLQRWRKIAHQALAAYRKGE
jgi:hypothetical protein